MVPGGAVSLQPLLAPAVSSVQPHISVGPAKAGASRWASGWAAPFSLVERVTISGVGGRWIALPVPSCAPCSCLDGRRRREPGT